MKLSRIGKRLAAAASTVGMALAITACGHGNTVDFVYVTSNLQNPGQVNAYVLDSETGALRELEDSPYPSGGRDPVYAVTSPNGKFLYVANHDDNTIVDFAVGVDGKLYPLQTVNTPGTEPVALAIDATGSNLYVLDYYAPAAPGLPSYTDLNPGPGAVVVLPLAASNGEMGTPLSVKASNYWQVQCFPTNLALTADGSYVYVTNTNAVVVTTSPPVTGTVPTLPAACPAHGTISGFSVGASGSAPLTEVSGSPWTTGTGSEPTGIAADPGNGAIYVTDGALNLLYTETIGSGGALTRASTLATGTMPMGAMVVATTSGKFLYVSNYTDGTLSSYTLGAGTPAALATTSSGASGPLCMVADPRLQRFLYSTDYTGGRVGGAELNPQTGILVQNQGSPYRTTGQPTCIAAVEHKQGKTNGL
ncbi:MAG TPA: beta-propeller fold lactonase family protein [Acidobacteriaceae bacterium]|nr:beta-propeller fold lactonase family protein [Acidobacteriaceae bacterium]